jgi:hypothetical protein
MDVRYLIDSDYEILVDWWKDWRWDAPPRDMLPQDGLGGLMVSKDGVDICAGFIYFTNSKTAWIEFIVSNFNYKEKDRKQALEFLISSLVDITRDVNKCKYIYTSLKSSSLIKRYENCGFKSGSTSCTEMIMVI